MQLLRFQRHALSSPDGDAAPAGAPESDPKSRTEHPETSAARNSAAPHRLNVRMDIIPDPTKRYRHFYSMPGRADAGAMCKWKFLDKKRPGGHPGPCSWWSRRELNPRPQALCRQFYMFIRFTLSFNLGSCQPTGPSLAIHINLRPCRVTRQDPILCK